jgi:hypothetical protein
MAERQPETAKAPSFEDLVLDFYVGLQHEAKRLRLGGLDVHHTILAPRLREIYKNRHQRRSRKPMPNIRGHAMALGQITALVFCDEKRNRNSVDPPGAMRIQARHIDVAREVYGFYMSSEIRKRMNHPEFIPIEPMEETDQPCPLCP